MSKVDIKGCIINRHNTGQHAANEMPKVGAGIYRKTGALDGNVVDACTGLRGASEAVPQKHPHLIGSA